MKVTDLRFAALDVLAMLALVGGIAALWLMVGKAWAMWATGALVANHVVGAIVCASVDDEQESLRKWADEAPSMVLAALITQAWPLILWLMRKERA